MISQIVREAMNNLSVDDSQAPGASERAGEDP